MGFSFQDLVNACEPEWRAYIRHEFVCRLGQGCLDEEAFRHYLKQDYLFLIQFARAYALAGYKSRNLEDLRHAHEGMKAILDMEMGLHVQYCRNWSITAEQLSEVPEARATMAYTRYVLDTGNRGDLLDLHVALAPCLVGYGEIANWLNERTDTVRGEINPYDAWIGMYESDDFQAAMHSERDWLDSRLSEITPVRFNEVVGIFRDAIRLEIDFWQMGLDRAP